MPSYYEYYCVSMLILYMFLLTMQTLDNYNEFVRKNHAMIHFESQQQQKQQQGPEAGTNGPADRGYPGSRASSQAAYAPPNTLEGVFVKRQGPLGPPGHGLHGPASAPGRSRSLSPQPPHIQLQQQLPSSSSASSSSPSSSPSVGAFSRLVRAEAKQQNEVIKVQTK